MHKEKQNHKPSNSLLLRRKLFSLFLHTFILWSPVCPRASWTTFSFCSLKIFIFMENPDWVKDVCHRHSGLFSTNVAEFYLRVRLMLVVKDHTNCGKTRKNVSDFKARHFNQGALGGCTVR